MQQQYDNLETENLSKDRSPSLLATIAALEAEGFYQGTDDIQCDIVTVTTHGEWEIKVGYTDTYLYVTVSLQDGSRWLTDLKSCEDEFPSYQELLTGDPKSLADRMAAIKQQKYERMMQAIAWMKELVVRSPSPKHILALAESAFQCLGNVGDYKINEGYKFLEIYEESFKDWTLKSLHREDDWVLLDAVHKSGQYWQNGYRYDPTVSLKSYVEILKQLLSV
ncbi:hypothetical protein [Microseira sp. BLCC-F43]|jgi:hypothetical protein|uniref:hypothetical protein n=1 Tax=Microseira sp. BLCC-F43 TaxID=3153602 RepID=UPI0035B86C8E